MKNNIGIVGGGQLGRMMALEAKKLGFFVTVIDPTVHSPAAQVSDKHIVASFNDEKAIRKLASEVDVITIEIEHINTHVLQELVEKGYNVNPLPETLSMIKNKYNQKEFLQQNTIPTARFKEVTTEQDIIGAGKEYSYPLLLKAKHDAYDGRGNAIIKSKKDINEAMQKLNGKELYIEQYVPFVMELAVMVARSLKGDIAVYPVVQTIHKNNICHTVIAPAPINTSIQKKAQQLAKKVMNYLKGAGVFGIEMFLLHNGKVLINEIAPRVHNSGHYTTEACYTSQFEQHIRAITGLPLGNTNMIVPHAVMINILGEREGTAEIMGLDNVLQMSNVNVHIYGKHDTKVERKMGHITVIGNDAKEVLNKAQKARKRITI